jgi:hypothetical protein
MRDVWMSVRSAVLRFIYAEFQSSESAKLRLCKKVLECYFHCIQAVQYNTNGRLYLSNHSRIVRSFSIEADAMMFCVGCV